jgi:hypothetical protein
LGERYNAGGEEGNARGRGRDDDMTKNKKKGQETAAVNKCGKTLVLSRTEVTKDRVWIGGSIYCPLMTPLYRSLTHSD